MEGSKHKPVGVYHSVTRPAISTAKISKVKLQQIENIQYFLVGKVLW